MCEKIMHYHKKVRYETLLVTLTSDHLVSGVMGSAAFAQIALGSSIGAQPASGWMIATYNVLFQNT